MKDPNQKWRNLTALFTIVVLASGIGWQVFQYGDHAPFIFSQNQEDTVIGGDAIIEPPEEIGTPPFPELIDEEAFLDPALFTAKSIMAKDHETGLVLYQKNAYEQRPIASITKLMSALVFLEKDVDWSREAVVVGEDSLGTHMYAGDTYTLDELWKASLVASSNKAIKTLANALEWPEEAFVERMNQKAIELGMTATYFTDATGLDATDVSTASDITILIAEAMKHEEIREAVNELEIRLYSNERAKSHQAYNTNWLLLGWIPNDFGVLVGGKTGYTPEAGWNFTMQVGDEDGHLIDVVVLGTEGHEERFTEARDVANWVFEHYRWPDEENDQEQPVS